MKIRNFLFLFFLLSVSLCSSAQIDTVRKDSSVTYSLSSAKKNKTKPNKVDLENHFRFLGADSIKFAAPAYDDSHWPVMGADSTDTIFDYKGVIWFRCELRDTGLFKIKPVALSVKTTGAAELYLNGKLIKKLGRIGKDVESTVPSAATLDEILPIAIKGKTILSIRFRKVETNEHPFIHMNDAEGIFVHYATTESLIDEIRDERENIRVPLFFSGVFISLTVFHFMLFFYYRKNRTNLYYALFTLLLFVIFYSFYKIFNGADIFLLQQISTLLLFSIFLVPLFFLGILYEVFYKRLLRLFWILCLVLTASLLSMIYLESTIALIILPIYVLFCFGETIRVFIKAWDKNKDGAGIFFFGILFPLFGVVIMAIISSILENYGYEQMAKQIDSNSGAFFGYGMLMSMSISMTIYLARDFARMNNKLYAQITEIKSLLDKTIIQENERKRILENQKADLERMVSIRTEEVEKQKAELEQKNRDILDNLIYAKRIQDAILPDERLIKQSLKESFIIYYPKDIVSGDFYTYSHQHGKILISAADCTGHGVTGAFMSMIGSSLLNQIINEGRIISPDLILNQLNSGIIESLKQSNSEVNDGMDIAMCVFDLENMRLQYAGANRPLWIVRKNELIDIKPDKFPIGGLQFKRDANFRNHDVSLQSGDTIYIFTDGYADQFGGAEGKKLLSKRFREKLLNIQHLSMQTQEESLKDFFNDWKGHYPQVDDVLVIGIRV